MVVLGNTAETLAFVEKVPGISVINYGGIAQKEGAQQFGKAIYLTEQEIADSQALKPKASVWKCARFRLIPPNCLTINSEPGGHYVAHRNAARPDCRTGHS